MKITFRLVFSSLNEGARHNRRKGRERAANVTFALLFLPGTLSYKQILISQQEKSISIDFYKKKKKKIFLLYIYTIILSEINLPSPKTYTRGFN